MHTLFADRVGAGVTLLRKYGSVRAGDGVMSFWPDAAAWRGQPPLVLRRLRRQVSRLTMGVALPFRTMKPTFGRNKRRRRTPDRAVVGLDCALLGLWQIQLFAIHKPIELGVGVENPVY